MSRIINQNFRVIVLGFSLLLVSLAVIAIASVTSTSVVRSFDQQAYKSYMDSELTSLSDLTLSFEAQQSEHLPLAPPSDSFAFIMDAGLTVFDAKGFPANFVKSLAPRFLGGVTTYPITVMEDSVTRARLVLNASGDVIATVETPYSYNPSWLALEMYPGLKSSTADLLAMYDPARIAISYELVDEKNLVNYLLQQSADVAVATQEAASSQLLMSITPKMMYVPAVTNLMIAGMEKVTNGIRLTLAYPAGFTNKLDIFTNSDLVTFWWNVIDTVNVDVSTNAIEWVDTTTTNLGIRFYSFGNADVDSDGDGLTDAREKYLYHSCPTNSDTDGDGRSDYYEVMTLNTDPSNPATNRPIAFITYPTNNFNSVWIP